MFNQYLLMIAVFFAVLISIRAVNAQRQIQIPSDIIVVELFTSQSCSSCPPADKILAELSYNENIIALSCHVQYWNHLHWKDTLSREFCDMRQHGYSAIDGSKRIYTPQMVVNGTHKFIGSHGHKLKDAMKKASHAPLKKIDVTNATPETISFLLPDAAPGNYRLWAFGYQNSYHQHIKDGENKGIALTYTNPVATYTNLGAWDGRATQHTFDKPEGKLGGIAVFAQKNGYGEIIAAGKLNFKDAI